ncbi:hypothetical protein GBAR_LOCUS1283 [Geodia barretti]|nr:hypothetical protein GBAR_LOCUS1283 [Geodia barretti]
MMSVHQQCPANDSTYTETLSVDSEGEYELTGLDPGLQYCVRLAGRTSAGAGPFSHTLIPWHTNSVFTVKLQMSYCTEWIAVKPAEIVEDLSRAFSSGIELTCNCTFTSDYIADGQLTCRNDILIFQGRIISTTDRNSTDLLTNFETWLSTDPTIMARGEELKLFKNERFTESENRNQSIVGATAGVAAVLILLVALVIVLILWRINRRKLSMAVGCRLASATSLNSIAADYEEPLKTVFSKPPMKDRKPIPAPNTFPKPLKVTPKPLELSPRQQKPPLQPPPKNPSISREKANKHALKEQKTSLIDCEMPIAGTENVYDDPDNITSGAKDGIASFPNIAYNRPSTKGTQK